MLSDNRENTKKRQVYPGLTIGEAECSQIEQKFEGIYENAPPWRSPSLIKTKDPNSMQAYLIKKIKDEDCTDLCLKVLNILLELEVKVFVQKNTLEEMENRKSERLPSIVDQYTEEHEMDINILVIIGGDGTIMYSLKDFQKRVAPPIVAFSKGTLNYLANFPVKDYEKNLRKIITAIKEGQLLEIEKRYRVYCELKIEGAEKPQTYHALNEVVLGTGTNPTIMSIDCFLEGKHLATFEGDGVMVSTPTGSTAYQLSTGGPIINHLMSCLSISQIAGLTLSTRALVLPSAVRLVFKMKPGCEKEALLNLDGQIKLELTPKFELLVTGSEYYVPFIVGDTKDTFDNWIYRLRNMLGWNRNFSDQNGNEKNGS